MLNQVDLTGKTSASEYKRLSTERGYRLGALQREARRNGLPTIVVCDGWGASGKGTVINELVRELDPRGFVVHTIKPPNPDELLRPYLWRFWARIPSRGQMAIFIRSWYSDAFLSRGQGKLGADRWQRVCASTCAFESQLLADGYLIVKLFLHISKKEQKKRFKALEADPDTAWRVTRQDRKNHKHYEQLERAVDDLFERTSSPGAPWTVIPGHDWRFATLTALDTLTTCLARRLECCGESAPGEQQVERRISFPPAARPRLPSVDLTCTLDHEAYKHRLGEFADEIRRLQHRAYRHRLPVAIVFEGWDAAGKGGSIKRLVHRMDPRGYRVIPVSAPSAVEKAHAYLWRFWQHAPRAGHFAVFDRSWYGRVLVEAVEGYCTAVECERAYREIVEMESCWAESGTLILKFWLHLDADEQLRRFEQRQQDPHKQWKITVEDWRNRTQRPVYERAVEAMLERTHTEWAPWTIVESNSKLHARIKILRTVIGALTDHL